MSSLSSNNDAAPKDAENIANFDKAIQDWTALSSGDTITGEFFNFVKSLANLAGNLGDVLSVVNKYL
ncbi:hypothetical protein [Corynebacterium timonense]|uniref:Uncharacterized protein n=1 Tax=Corynebacterium timonense TaxID=441500 RepID=A0A1H1L4D9_9CORY|nr:hypothetical protein [Corynebacterium timonense]SDR68769.1 hypothetical protein SAMN04488539_0035 [Corynebacterium timonense]